MKKIIIMALLALGGKMMAGNLPEDFELKARIGYNIGGTAPVGIPASIRSIDKFSLTPSFMFGVDALMPFHERLGLLIGLRFENKGMDVEATTKSYHMEVKKGESVMDGVYTGHVRQKVHEWMFTLPIQLAYRLSDKVQLKAGPYVSMMIDKDFSGYVYDGYLRQGNPTGPKVTMGKEENERATYDFSDDMRGLQFGVAAGVDWQFAERFGLFADLSWGLTGIFNSDFKTVEQTLFPIYGTIGVSYRIR